MIGPMGADIHGYVECRPTYGTLDEDDASWYPAIDLNMLYGGRDYDAFGCLFGARNYAGFRPLAAGRGLPHDVSDHVRQEFESFPDLHHSPTWIGWPELASVDWDEAAERVDGRVHEYVRAPGGGWELAGKSFQDTTGRPEGAQWASGGRCFRVARMTRREAVPADGEWAPVWTVMRTLAAVHGGGNVRLAVWFDN